MISESVFWTELVLFNTVSNKNKTIYENANRRWHAAATTSRRTSANSRLTKRMLCSVSRSWSSVWHVTKFRRSKSSATSREHSPKICVSRPCGTRLHQESKFAQSVAHAARKVLKILRWVG